MTNPKYDVLIIGGGIMGSASAYYLTLFDPRLRVAVVEKDPTYQFASTTLSMSNARIQFSLGDNIRISQYTFQVLSEFEEIMAVGDNRPHIAWRQEGNLFLYDEAGRSGAESSLALQRRLGCRVEWWNPDRIQETYPLYNPEGLVGGVFGPQDGHFDAYAVLMAYRAKARSQGATYLNDEVTRIRTDAGRAQGVDLKSGERLTGQWLINCAGAWCAQIAATAGVTLPVQPVKRQVFVLDTKVKPAGALPLTVLPSGLYFRTETGGTILLGKSMADDPVGFDFNWDDQRFNEILWPELAEFVPAFDTLKLMRGWAGLYAMNTLDSNAILGEWPELPGLLLANGFSGHGLQQAPAVGRYMAELILGREPALDLSAFSPRRILENRPLCEGGCV